MAQRSDAQSRSETGAPADVTNNFGMHGTNNISTPKHPNCATETVPCPNLVRQIGAFGTLSGTFSELLKTASHPLISAYSLAFNVFGIIVACAIPKK